VETFAAFFVWWPVAVLAHELGHAAVALRLVAGPVEVDVGDGRFLTLRLGRLTLRAGPPFLGGECRVDRAVTPLQGLLILGAGPLINLVTALAALAAAEGSGSALAEGLGLASLAAAAASLWPAVSVSGAPSDGHQLARMLGWDRGSDEPAPAPRAWALAGLLAAGCLVLAVEPGKADLVAVAALGAFIVRRERRGSPRPTPRRSPR